MTSGGGKGKQKPRKEIKIQPEGKQSEGRKTKGRGWRKTNTLTIYFNDLGGSSGMPFDRPTQPGVDFKHHKAQRRRP
jgi:hypothetical protein